MNITKTVVDNTVTLTLVGRLDTVTSNLLSTELDIVFAGGSPDLVFNLKDLDYVSSAGLRVFLTAQKKVKSAGKEMKIIGASESVKEIFEVTGFAGIMNIE